jgi:starvation-inducible outer membrane lipoprotein
MNIGKYIAPVLMLVTLTGCVAPDPIANNFHNQAKPLTLTQVAIDPGGAQGSIVIWGGRVVDVANDTNGGNLFIMQLPLAQNEKPLVFGESTGPFIAMGGDYLDPEAFHYGQLVTVAGVVVGVRTEMVNNVPCACPVVEIRQSYLWPKMQDEYAYRGVGYGTPGESVGPDWWLYGDDYRPRGYYGKYDQYSIVYGTPGHTVGQDWWLYNGDYHPPDYYQIYQYYNVLYGTPGQSVGPSWWWYGGNYYPPDNYDGSQKVNAP